MLAKASSRRSVKPGSTDKWTPNTRRNPSLGYALRGFGLVGHSILNQILYF